jgi:uncharacterized protein (TIGR03435 family)
MGRTLAIFLTVGVAGLFGIFGPDLVGPVLARIKAYEDHKPNFAPSSTLHISPARSRNGGGNYSGPDFWNLQGFALKPAISTVTEMNPIRIDLPAALDTITRYDFALVLPTPDSPENMRSLLIEGIERQFHVVAAHEKRLREVYVLTASEKTPQPSHGFNPTAFERGACEIVRGSEPDRDHSKPMAMGQVGSIGISGTADAFSHHLEGFPFGGLDRPVVNETGLEGEFVFLVSEPKDPPPCDRPANDFVERLRDQLGLIVTIAQREVDTLVFSPSQR